MDNFAEALAAIRDLKEAGVVNEYAIGGAMAVAFWCEPTATFDLAVFVSLHSSGMLISLAPIYEWASKRGYPAKGEHIIMAGVPVQLIPAHDKLAEEAVATAADLDYDGQPMRVIRPEYLIAMALIGSARTQKRAARAAQLLEEAHLDRDLLDDLMKRYKFQLPQP